MFGSNKLQVKIDNSTGFTVFKSDEYENKCKLLIDNGDLDIELDMTNKTLYQIHAKMTRYLADIIKEKGEIK